jgi:hypothetical protein
MNARKKNSELGREAGTIIGLFPSQPQAERAIHDLKDAGFPDDRIGVVMKDPARQQRLSEDMGTKAGEGAATGAIGGAVVGGVLGLLAGVGALVIPGVGPIIAGGALASTLAGAGIGAAAGGLLGALAGMGIPEEEARYYERGVREGGILVTVAVAGRAIDARRILTHAGADLAPAGGTFAAEGSEIAEEGREIRIPLTKEHIRVVKTPVVKEARVEETGAAGIRDRTEAETEPWRGNERRYRHDRNYTGPERREAGI